MSLPLQYEGSVTLNALHETISAEALPAPFAGMYAWNIRSQVGESPVWDADSNSLFWIDVRAPAVLRLFPATGRLTRWLLPEVVGALALAQGNQVLLALRRRLALLDTETGKLTLLPEVACEPEGNRLNEGKVSPSGKWFVFGSMDDRPGQKQATGGLYRADAAGGIKRLHEGLVIANGIAWSADGESLYFSDSHAGKVWRAPWHESLGSMGRPELFANSPEAAGRPDGALLNSAGQYVSAGVSAACLNTFTDSGTLLYKTALPIRAPTMPSVGGADGSRLFVTSLIRPGWALEGNHDGKLIEMAAPFGAMPAIRWRELGGC